MSIIRYARASADLSRLATWSVLSGTEDTTYPASNFTGFDPTKPAKLLTPTGVWLADRGDSPSAITCVALIHANLANTTEVRIKASANADLSSPTLNSVITVPALSDNWPINPYLVFASNASRYVGICITGTNPVAVSIGHVALVTELLNIDRAQQGVLWRDDIPTWDDETELSVPMNMDLLTRLRAVTFQTSNRKDAMPALDSWYLDARGINLPFLFIQDISINECYWMTFAEKFKEVTYQWETQGGGQRTWQVKLKEFGRGLLPTPWLT